MSAPSPHRRGVTIPGTVLEIMDEHGTAISIDRGQLFWHVEMTWGTMTSESRRAAYGEGQTLAGAFRALLDDLRVQGVA